MKKHVITVSTILVILSIVIIGFTNWSAKETAEVNLSNKKTLAFENQNMKRSNDNVIPELYYGVDTRFTAIKKTDLAKVTTIYDFLTDEEAQQIAHINSVKVIIIKDNQQSEMQEYGTDAHLTDAQIKLIRSTEHFNHFTIRTDFKEKHKDTGKMEERFFGPHLTVVPDTQAIYIDGKASLINYLKENSNDDMTIITEGKLGAIKLSFIVTKNGTVSNITHDAMTTGYPSLDEKFIQLLKNIPGKWIPAENSKGEKVDQELVFTFGPVNGC
ncbi:hypothetical protein SAMN04515667_2805 [Formosa sp. Hel1_31_208]|uniref:hypothetical protein n=1 Tax=Formosa sp. Hel1_31_208 TaxID=1798225 RepID=UPI00087B4101|nr:hypothetical protein [Formosa sp. Hel1_31_208]SDS71345.1 hypothetical protein SAMN04515667_2805 [Formosa sp. Hel1_31_208]